MKINITVDVDWIEEGGDIDAEVKDEIISGVKRAISKQCLDKVEKEASTRIDKAISDSVNSAQKAIEAKALKFADDWLENEVTISDKWGDAQECLTIKDLVKRTFDNLMEKKVDKDGRFNDSSYNGTRLMDWLTGQRVQSVVESKLKGLSKDIDDQITKAVNQGIRDNVSNKFAEMVIQTAKANQHLSIDSKA